MAKCLTRKVGISYDQCAKFYILVNRQLNWTMRMVWVPLLFIDLIKQSRVIRGQWKAESVASPLDLLWWRHVSHIGIQGSMHFYYMLYAYIFIRGFNGGVIDSRYRHLDVVYAWLKFKNIVLFGKSLIIKMGIPISGVVLLAKVSASEFYRVNGFQ